MLLSGPAACSVNFSIFFFIASLEISDFLNIKEAILKLVKKRYNIKD